MMDLDNNSLCKECAMVCTDIHYEDRDEDIIVYRDKGASTKKYNKDMYGELTKIESKEEQNVNYNVALCARDSVLLEKK